MMQLLDYIVVGSGCTGAMAAQTLIDAGKHVTMLDAGMQPADQPSIPDTDFATLRMTDPEQYHYFLGSKLEGVTWGKVGKGEQLTPPRKHMLTGVEGLLPSQGNAFTNVESLGYGGLGIGWGIGCWEWSDSELRAAGLQPKTMRQAYQVVADRIGISATDDSARDYTIGTLKKFQPSADMDANDQLLYQKYQQHETALRAQGFVMGRAPLALLTQPKEDRQAYRYRDLDFYSDADRSAYRPWMTVDHLRANSNSLFSYIPKRLVTRFEEQTDHTIVHCLDTVTLRPVTYRCRTLVLAPGVLGSARIALRSTKQTDQQLPLLCNPYSYVPCIQPARVGKEIERHKLGFAQLSFFLDEQGDNFGAAMASLYSYQSLMLFRMARQVPLGFADTRTLLQYLTSGILIMGIHQPDSPSDSKYVRLVSDTTSPTGDRLECIYQPSTEEQAQRNRREKQYISAMHRLGAHALKRIDPGFGSSIHYAGTIPFSNKDQPLTLAANGRLHGSRRVFVADGSGFTYLPAKGLTFSLMANAHLVATEAARA